MMGLLDEGALKERRGTGCEIRAKMEVDRRRSRGSREVKR